MAHDYSEEGDHQGAGGFLVAFCAGALVGAGLSLLFAPKAGSEMRAALSKRATGLAGQAQESYRHATEGTSQWVGRGKNVVSKARDAFARAVEEGEKAGQHPSRS